MNIAAAQTITPEAAVAGLLNVLRALAAGFVAAFGDPAALIKAGALYGKTRERTLRWLHDMECVLRRLLLLRAALFPTPPLRDAAPLKRRAARRGREGAPETLFGPSDDPARWRVSFRMPTPPEPIWMLGGFKAHEDRYELGHRVAGAPETEISLRSIGYWADDPRPIAERFEALRRVIEDHELYAARLAQRLYDWRGREEGRQLFLYSLNAVTPIANEADLPDADWQMMADVRPILQALIPVFAGPRPPRAGP